MEAAPGALDLALSLVYSVLFLALIVLSYRSFSGPRTRK